MRCLSILSILLLSFAFPGKASKKNAPLPEKIINITIDEKGLAYMGRDTLTLIEVTEELHLRLWKSYLGTGKMPNRILITYKGNVSSANQAAADKAIKEAQQKTLQEYCVHKHKKRYEEINSSQQKKVRKQFPVLFQQYFTSEQA